MIKNKQVIARVIATLLILTVAISPAMLEKEKVVAKKKEKKYKVVRVIDGDTIIAKRKNKKYKIRLLGVDAPESVHPVTGKNDKCGERASKYTKKKLLNKKVTIEYGKDKYDRFGRRLAYVYIKKKMFNKMLISAGHAKVQFFKPNTRYRKTFLKLEFEAKTTGKGLWKYETASGSHSCTFVGVTTTMKFHRSDCSYLTNANRENHVSFDGRSEAINNGYNACKVCKP